MYKNKLVKSSMEGDIAPALCEMTTVSNVGEAKPGHGACIKSMSRTNTRPEQYIYMYRFLLHAFENCY